MTDYPFENDYNDKPGNDIPETAAENVQSASAQPDYQEPVSEEPSAPVNEEISSSVSEETSASVDADYPNIYVNSADYSGSVSSQPEQEKAFENPYHYAGTVQSASTPVNRTPQTNNNYGDGFYHQSFTSPTGSHVNYTRPAAGYADPRTAQPDQAHYASPATAQASQSYATHAASTSQQPPRRKKKKGVRMTKGGIALLLVVCVLLAGAAGFGGSVLASKLNQVQYSSTDSDTMVIHKVDTEAKVAGTENLVDKTTSEITAEVADTVVEITTEVMQTNSFYGQYIAQGAGSGVIISSDGYILTNNHVIEDASKIEVTTRGGDSYEATLVGTDSEVDIALLKIDATDLPTAVFGDSDKLTVGSKAVIIGNPLGTLGGSVTEGIISALDRSIVIDDKTMHLMQTDAAINPGNSGGGMFNGQGELAGIVVAKSSSEEIDNIGFVIPINNVLDILGDLKDYGYVRGRADTGMTFIDLTNQMYAYYYYGNTNTGVYISSVENGSNAAEAGFKQGDRVISVDGKAISEASEIETLISEKSAGDTVTFELDRGGSNGTLELKLDEKVPDSKVKNNSSSQSDNSFGNGGNNGSNGNGGNGGGSQQSDPFSGTPFEGWFR